jgi:hypothetical protein
VLLAVLLIGADIPEFLQEVLQWTLTIVPIAVLGLLGAKWAVTWIMKKAFPSLTGILYFLIPTYLVCGVLVISIGERALNAHTAIDLSMVVFLLLPPLVWDALFGMGVVEGRLDLLFLSVFFIVAMPLWIAAKTTVGFEAGPEEDKSGRPLFAKRVIGAWVIVIIMGLGIPNFSTFIFERLLAFSLLGLNGIFWAVAAVAAGAGIFALLRHRKGHGGPGPAPEGDSPEGRRGDNCQLIDGRWVCEYGEGE